MKKQPTILEINIGDCIVVDYYPATLVEKIFRGNLVEFAYKSHFDNKVHRKRVSREFTVSRFQYPPKRAKRVQAGLATPPPGF